MTSIRAAWPPPRDADRLAGERPAARARRLRAPRGRSSPSRRGRASCGAGGATPSRERRGDRPRPGRSSGAARLRAGASAGSLRPGPRCSAPAPPCSAVEPVGEALGAGAEPGEAAGQALRGAFELPDPVFEPASRLRRGRLRPPLTAVGDAAQASGLRCGPRRSPGPGSASCRACGRSEGSSLRGFGELRWRVRGRGRGRCPGSSACSERRPSCRVRLPTAVFALRVGELLRALGEARDRAARLLAAGRGPFEAAGEQAGALAAPVRRRASSRALPAAPLARPPRSSETASGGAAQAGAEAGEVAGAARARRR